METYRNVRDDRSGVILKYSSILRSFAPELFSVFALILVMVGLMLSVSITSGVWPRIGVAVGVILVVSITVSSETPKDQQKHECSSHAFGCSLSATRRLSEERTR